MERPRKLSSSQWGALRLASSLITDDGNSQAAVRWLGYVQQTQANGAILLEDNWPTKRKNAWGIRGREWLRTIFMNSDEIWQLLWSEENHRPKSILDREITGDESDNLRNGLRGFAIRVFLESVCNRAMDLKESKHQQDQQLGLQEG